MWYKNGVNQVLLSFVFFMIGFFKTCGNAFKNELRLELKLYQLTWM